MNALARSEHLVPLNLEQSFKTLSLPEWLLRSASALTAGSEEVTREDGIKARRTIPTIIRSLAPTKAACSSIQARLEQLHKAKEATNIDFAMAAVTELLMAFNLQTLNEVGAKARARGYITALEDLPAWAIAEACRRWLRGDAGEQNYNFAPSPPVLRKVAESVLAVLEHQVSMLERLLSAKIIDDPPDFPDEHCKDMRGKLVNLLGSKALDEPKETAA